MPTKISAGVDYQKCFTFVYVIPINCELWLPVYIVTYYKLNWVGVDHL